MIGKKKLFLLFVFASAISALAVGLYLKPYLSEKPAEAASQTQSETYISTTSQDEESSVETAHTASEAIDRKQDVSKTGANYPASSGSQSQIVNGIEISVTNFRREGKYLKVDVCFDLPDDADWTIWHTPATFLDYGQGTVSRFGFELLEIREPSAGEMGRRCDTVHFEVPLSADLTNATLTIAAIGAEPREGEECSPRYLDKMQQALDARNSGLEVGCATEEWTSGFTIVNKPANMSQEEAEAIVTSDELFLDLFGIRGPWIFRFSLNE